MRYALSMDEENVPRSLDWEATYEIVLALIERYPDTNLDDVGIEQLFQWVIQLPGFADDPALANEDILNGILREWYEETHNL
ncbi:MAG: Fe-S cluster assembly protein IscX [Chloroflexota bacterium]